MKPISTNNLSAWSYIGLFILFCLPYVGTPATIICAFFAPNREVKSFARAILILTILGAVALFALLMLGVLSLDNFGVDIEGGLQALGGIRNYLNI